MSDKHQKILIFGFSFLFSLVFFMGEIIVLISSLCASFYLFNILINKYFKNRNFKTRVVFGAGDFSVKILLLFSAIFYIKIISFFWAENPSVAINNAFNHLQFLVWPLLFIFLRKANISIFKAEPLIASSLIVMFVWYGVVKLFYPNSAQSACFAAGAHSCGLLELTLAYMLVWMVLAFSRPNKILKLRVLYFSSFVLGFVVLLGTGRKTSLIGLFIAIVLIYIFRSIKKFRITYFFAFLTFCGFFVAASSFFVGDRFLQLAAEVQAYSSGGPARKDALNTSAGARMEMYRMAFEAFRERPLLGWGAGTKPRHVAKFATVPDNPPPYSVFHNQFLQTLVEVGIIGGIISLLICLYLIKKTIFDAFRVETKEYIFLLGGLYILYIIKSFMGSTFGYSHTNTVFVFFSAWLWANITSFDRCKSQ